MEIYGAAVADKLDNGRNILRRRYYRQHCTPDYGSYTKDLSAICSDLNRVSETYRCDAHTYKYIYIFNNFLDIYNWQFARSISLFSKQCDTDQKLVFRSHGYGAVIITSDARRSEVYQWCEVCVITESTSASPLVAGVPPASVAHAIIHNVYEAYS